MKKLTSKLRFAPNNFLNAFIAEFYSSPKQITKDNLAFEWLRFQNIIDDDGCLLYDEETIQKSIGFEIDARNGLVWRASQSYPHHLLYPRAYLFVLLKEYAHKKYGDCIINIVNPKMRTLGIYSITLNKKFSNINIEEFGKNLI